MKKLLLIALLAVGCSKSTDSPTISKEITGTYQMEIVADFYGDDGAKVFSRSPTMDIYKYTFDNGKVTGEGPAITGTYKISGDKMSLEWIDKYKNDSFSGDLNIQSNNKFVVTYSTQTDQTVEGKHITKAVFIRTFTK